MGVRVAWSSGMDTRGDTIGKPFPSPSSFFLLSFFCLFEKSTTAGSVLYFCRFYVGEKKIGKLVGFGLRTN